MVTRCFKVFRVLEIQGGLNLYEMVPESLSQLYDATGFY